ncbi:hypothetical protein IscW_ISCW015699 [Ixodes scapularis]|uniref:Uncharacterized protein n=1 Tax=Ixodes scapularis TaxID=6945 RepID=B7P0Y3_IXOSC|nr:hypothetical protein IscW_ISCW015699 [Ixodes scapularis]|eukprot:XP_002399697.1 hypothetical protein IscW_ISCW015699 [Ixodes scapularis]
MYLAGFNHSIAQVSDIVGDLFETALIHITTLPCQQHISRGVQLAFQPPPYLTKNLKMTIHLPCRNTENCLKKALSAVQHCNSQAFVHILKDFTALHDYSKH